MLIVSRGHHFHQTDNPNFLSSGVMALFQQTFHKNAVFCLYGLNQILSQVPVHDCIHLKLGTQVMFIFTRRDYINKAFNLTFGSSRVMPPFPLRISTKMQLFGIIDGLNPKYYHILLLETYCTLCHNQPSYLQGVIQ